MKTVFLFVGRTNSGKSTIAKKLEDSFHYSVLKSYTTRAQRNDTDTDHVFTDVAQYEHDKAAGCIVAETNIAGNYYWATEDQVRDCDIYLIDPVGIEALKKMNLPDIRFVTIYINVDDNVRFARAKKRGDDPRSYMVRNLSERAQFEQFLKDKRYDYVVKNENIVVSSWITSKILEYERTYGAIHVEDSN